MNPTIITPHGLSVPPRFQGRDAAIIDLRGEVAFLCDDWRYPLRDYILVSNRRTVVPLKDARATHRAFLMANQSRWVYAFTDGESHVLEADALLRQISAAVYKSSEPNAPSPASKPPEFKGVKW